MRSSLQQTLLLLSTATLLLLTSSLAIDSSETSSFRNLQNDNYVFNVTYEYQLDINPSSQFNTIQKGIMELEADVLENLDAFIGQVSNPPIAIQAISSVVKDDTCEPTVEGYECAMVETSVQTEVLNGDAGDLIEEATLERVQVYMADFNAAQEGSIVVTFVGPFIVNTEVVIEISPVDSEMDDTEIALLEGELYEILEPALENGSPSIDLQTAEFLYQDLTVLSTTRRELQGNNGRLFKNEAHMYVTGRCHGCNNDDMRRLVDDAVDANADAFKKELQKEGPENGVDYFDGVTTLEVGAATAPATPPPIPEDYVVDIDSNNIPYWVWVILGVAILMLGVALVILIRRKRQHTKQNAGDLYYGDTPTSNGSNPVFGVNEYDTQQHPADSQEYLEKPEVVDNPNYVAKQQEPVHVAEPVSHQYAPNSQDNVFAEPDNVFAHDHDENVFVQPKYEEPDNVFKMP